MPAPAQPGSPAERRAVLRVSAEAAWATLTDMRRHGDWVPMTRVDAPAALAVGDEIEAVTGPRARSGGRGLVDRMRVTAYDPPSTAQRRTGRARFVKLGPVLTGWAEIAVRPLGASACEVVWTERIGVRGVPGLLTDLVGRPATGLMLATVLRRAGRELEAGAAHGR